MNAKEQRIKELTELLESVKNKKSFAYLQGLNSLKVEYELAFMQDKAMEVAQKIIDLLVVEGTTYDEVHTKKVNQILVHAYDTRARGGDFRAFCIALEWNRPIDKKFYIPRMRLLNKHGIMSAFQDLNDDKLDLLVLNMPPRTGKQLSDDTPILTRRGWKKHGDLIVGDEVLNNKGEFVKVLATSEKSKSEYRVTFSNGEQIDCHGNHEWVVYDRYLRKDTVRETNYMIGKLKASDNKHSRFLLPEKQPVFGEHTLLPVDPYTLGACLKSVAHKNIPSQYLTASLEQRLELLAGLLDTDGTLRKKEHRYTFTTSEEELRDDFVSLINTFGWRTCVVEYKPQMSSSGIEGKHTCWAISFNPTFEIPCKLPRKQLKEFSKPRRISICKIEPLNEEKYGNCIQVEGGIYLAGRQLTPTHNSTISLFFLVFRAGLYPDQSILGSGHSTMLIQSFYNELSEVVISDEYRFKEIFPNIKLSYKNAEYAQIDFDKKKRYHTINFRSVDSGTTGAVEASNLLYCDDLVKDAEQANNKDRLDTLYHQYTSTLKDRKVQRLCKDGKYRTCPELHVNTPWSIYDVTNRIIRNEESKGNDDRVRIVSIPCWDEGHESNFMYEYGKGFDVQYYEDMQLAEDPVIFSAKYLMKCIERDGRPFERDNLTYFTELPGETPDRIIAYNDVSHGGEDYMSMPIAYVYGTEVYIADVLFQHNFGGDGVSRKWVRDKIIEHGVSRCGFEKNNGGDFYSTLIDKDLKQVGYRCNITSHIASTKQRKLDRILSCQNEILGIGSQIGDNYRIYFRDPMTLPRNCEYMDFLQNIWNWSQKEGAIQKKQHDDGIDSVAGLISNVLGKNTSGKVKLIDIGYIGY